MRTISQSRIVRCERYTHKDGSCEYRLYLGARGGPLVEVMHTTPGMWLAYWGTLSALERQGPVRWVLRHRYWRK